MSINGGEWAILLLLALLLVGPAKLPEYARKAAQWVKTARRMFADAKERVKSELGGDEVVRELSELNPARMHPAQLLREPGAPGDGEVVRRPQFSKSGEVHWDSEAT